MAHPHVSVQPVEASYQHSSGLYGEVQGPNVHAGARPTESGGFRVDLQANRGGVMVGHRNQHHDFGIGASSGVGGGVEVHGGEMPGMTVSVGSLQARARSTALGGSSTVTHDEMDMLRRSQDAF